MSGSAVAGVLFIIIVACILFLAVERRDKQLKQDAASYKPPEPVAVIHERSTPTFAGNICAVLLVLSVFFSARSYLEATTILQQIQATLAMIAGILLFGLGVALMRKRTYRVFETRAVADPAPAPPLPPEQPLHSWQRN